MSNSAQTPFRSLSFMMSGAKLSALPQDSGREVAIAGRSNAGKSTAINALAGQPGLARTSKTPGRTQLLNFFRLDAERRLVDLPGYGFARAPERAKRAWGTLVEGYLRERRSLAGVVLLMDSRRPLMPLDEQLLRWCEALGLPTLVVLAKADKLGRGRRQRARDQTRLALEALGSSAEVLLMSALKREGLMPLSERLMAWLAGDGEKSAPAPHSGEG